jgi:hypothetical protein
VADRVSFSLCPVMSKKTGRPFMLSPPSSVEGCLTSSTYISARDDDNQPFRKPHLTTLERSLAPPPSTDGRQTEKRAHVPKNCVEEVSMKSIALLLALFLAAVTIVHAQNQGKSYSTNLPDGTILPVQLSSTISLDKAVPGSPISARIAQDVPLENGVVLRRGTKVLGHIVSVTPGNPSRIAFTFDKVEYSKSNSLAVATNLRALASTLEIDGASLPSTGPDRGTPSVWWNTVQVGGEGLYGSGPLTRGEQVVGHWVWGGGAVGQVEANGQCRGEVAGNARDQSLWLFSTDACGVYGYSDVAIEHAGRTSPEGEITLTSTKPNLKIRAGSGILLRVDRSSPADVRQTS